MEGDVPQDLDEWMRSGKYLPTFMRDFHDQKNVFKRIAEMVNRSQERARSGERPLSHMELPNWVEAHIYVVDFFLWYMARHGYTLQRSRKPLAFSDIEDDLSTFRLEEQEAFYAVLKAEIEAKKQEGQE